MDRFFTAVTSFVFLFLLLPVAYVITSSFNASSLGGYWGGFTLKWYTELYHHQEVWEAIATSLYVGAISSLLAVTLGTCSAFALHRYRSKLQILHKALIYAPLLIPDIHIGISLLILFMLLSAFIHFEMGLITLIVAHTTFCISYVVMVMLSRFQNFNFALIEAAQDLGGSRWVVFKHILFPLLAPALVSSAALCMTLSIDDFIITFFVAGAGSTTLPLYIFSLMKNGKPPMIAALSTLLICGTFLILISLQIIAKLRGERRRYNTAAPSTSPET